MEYVKGGAVLQARAERELILAGGAINSPHLLMLSGIGDAGQLRSVGIDMKLHLPGVGANLQDHLAAAVVHWRKGESRLAHALRADRIAWAMLRAYFTGKGPATELPGGVAAVIRSREGLGFPGHPVPVQRRGNRCAALAAGVWGAAGATLSPCARCCCIPRAAALCRWPRPTRGKRSAYGVASCPSPGI